MRWAIAHALLFRAAAIKEVGCFDERFWKCGEDVDICSRLRDRGWEIFYVKGTSCRSIQEDSLGNLARAEFNRFCVERDFGRSAAIVTSRAFQRSIRHVLFGRVLYLPVEFGIWCTALQISWRKRSV